LALLFESISFGLVVAFIVLGLIGTVIPMIPGSLLIWVAVLIYVLVNGMASIGWFVFIIITLIALATGTADLWMPLLGAKTVGTSGRGLVYGVIGAIIGTLIAPLIGTLIGYAGGCLWAGDPDMDGELEAIVLGASVTFQTGFTGVRQ